VTKRLSTDLRNQIIPTLCNRRRYSGFYGGEKVMAGTHACDGRNDAVGGHCHYLPGGRSRSFINGGSLFFPPL